MAKNDFEKVKGQLKELSELINSFKSEAVQLKLIDMIFQEGNPVEVRSSRKPKEEVTSGANADSEITEVKVSTGKKRGRKPGTKLAPKVNEIDATEPVEVATEPAAPKKRGRKPKIQSLDASVQAETVKIKPVKAIKVAKITKAKLKAKGKSKKGKNDRPGPSKMLDQLVTEGYFSQPRPIGDVVSYCKEQHNLEYKTTDISGILMRMVKKNRLSRHTNSDKNQFEYFNFAG